jgi:hypothetical protein
MTDVPFLSVLIIRVVEDGRLPQQVQPVVVINKVRGKTPISGVHHQPHGGAGGSSNLMLIIETELGAMSFF